MSLQSKFYFLMSTILVIVAGVVPAAVLPNPGDSVTSKGFTRIDFCQADNTVYAFNGLNLYCYDVSQDSFVNVFSGIGSTVSDVWDPADFGFLTDSNDIILPTGQSERVVFGQVSLQIAQEKTSLQRNYFSVTSRYRANESYANGVGTAGNTIYKINMVGDGNEIQVCEVSNANSGGIAFDFADNLYISDFAPIYSHPQKLGNVSVYRISCGQLDAFAEDENFVVEAELIVKDVVLAGSDSIAIDANYNIYLGSYVGIAEIIPTDDPCDYDVIELVGDIDHIATGFPWPPERFGGITSDIRNGIVYYSKSILDYDHYDPYELYSLSVVAATDFSADLDGDGIVDFYDIILFGENYLFGGQYIRGDINTNGYVDMKDFAIIAKQWLNMAKWY